MIELTLIFLALVALVVWQWRVWRRKDQEKADQRECDRLLRERDAREAAAYAAWLAQYPPTAVESEKKARQIAYDLQRSMQPSGLSYLVLAAMKWVEFKADPEPKNMPQGLPELLRTQILRPG